MYKKVSPQEFKELLEKNDEGVRSICIDVRPEEIYLQGHIEGAVSTPFGQLEAKMGALVDMDKIFVYCNSGNTSTMACEQMQGLGAELYELEGGIQDWSGKGFEVSK